MKSYKGADKDGIVRHRNENGLFHREDGPAVILPNGDLQWWLNGKSYNTKEEWLIATHILKLQKNKN